MSLTAAARDALIAAAGAGGAIPPGPDTLRYEEDWRGRRLGPAALVLRPATVEAASAIVRVANEYRVPLVPQAGNTGLVLGGAPDASGGEVVVSVERMNRIRSVDADDFSLVAEAGCILTEVQDAAAAVDRLFPLSLGAEGSARIGGLISTNAGGVQVLRYGTMRALVLGLEAVLPDGQVLNTLTALRKDNTGYDIKQLLIGAEGTLGLVTAATLKLFARPRTVVAALLALPTLDGAMTMLNRLRQASGEQLSAFEVMPGEAFDLVRTYVPGVRDPRPAAAPWYALAEATSAADDPALAQRIEAALGEALEAGILADAALAASESQRLDFWRVRESIPEAEKKEGPAIKHDVSVAPARMAAYIQKATTAVEQGFPGARVLAFGHLGDGNAHFNVRAPKGVSGVEWAAQTAAVNRLVHDIAVDMQGSISAEHGIGLLKREELARTVDPAKAAAMRAIRQALDPNGIFNRGRVFLG